MKDPLLEKASVRGLNESQSSHRKPRKKGPLRHPKNDAALEAVKSRGGDRTSGVSPARRPLSYLDDERPEPIKPTVMSPRLDRGDLAARWQVEFGRRLSAARVSVGLSQRGLARKAGIRRPHLGKLEAGKMEPRVSTVFAIADALGVLARRIFPTMSWQTDDSITDL
jgi:DNA-binding XRE family transcriptional regulator